MSAMADVQLGELVADADAGELSRFRIEEHVAILNRQGHIRIDLYAQRQFFQMIISVGNPLRPSRVGLRADIQEPKTRILLEGLWRLRPGLRELVRRLGVGAILRSGGSSSVGFDGR